MSLLLLKDCDGGVHLDSPTGGKWKGGVLAELGVGTLIGVALTQCTKRKRQKSKTFHWRLHPEKVKSPIEE